ncbi:MAG: biosynthetic-type acetolactate synthase large subunit [Firmicutes bacterium]|nr:biosynthetic-type acetolactate synthase large subunit [Bacillota bacterium]
MKLTGSQIVCEVLLDHGVDTVFGYPGGAALNIYDELYRYQDRITHVISAHEQGATHAADGYARATGKTGVVFSTSGPGATNLVTGIATAYMDSIPMVCICSNVNSELIGRDAFQEIYITGITIPITKQTYYVNHIEDLEPALRDAFKVAASGRRGPVLIDITKDVSVAMAEFTNKAPLPLDPIPEIPQDTLQEAAKLVNNSKKPLLYVGGGLIASSASAELEALIDKADIPMVHTLMAAGAISCDKDLNLGLVGMHGTVASNRAVDQADLVISLGARYSDRVALNPDKWARKATIVQVDIDRSEMNKNVYVDVECTADIKDFLTQLLPLVNKAKHEEWHERTVGWTAKDRKAQGVPGYMHPKDVLEAISDAVGEDAIFATDVGQHQMWAAQYLKHRKAHKFLTSGGLGTMGFGYGAAIGAKMGCPDETVVHITGDGSFHMNMNEACTAVSYKLPIITVLMDNQVLGMVYQWQTAFYGGRYSNTCLERKTDFVKVAEGFGCKGYRAETLEELKAALAEAVKSDVPVWIQCVISREEKVLPMIPGGKTVDDMIVE